MDADAGKAVGRWVDRVSWTDGWTALKGLDRRRPSNGLDFDPGICVPFRYLACPTVNNRGPLFHRDLGRLIEDEHFSI